MVLVCFKWLNMKKEQNNLTIILYSALKQTYSWRMLIISIIDSIKGVSS